MKTFGQWASLVGLACDMLTLPDGVTVGEVRVLTPECCRAMLPEEPPLEGRKYPITVSLLRDGRRMVVYRMIELEWLAQSVPECRISQTIADLLQGGVDAAVDAGHGVWRAAGLGAVVMKTS